MNQPTKEDITQKVELSLSGRITREDVCDWIRTYIVNDDKVIVQDIDAWHYLIAISNIDEKILPKEYLFGDEDMWES